MQNRTRESEIKDVRHNLAKITRLISFRKAKGQDSPSLARLKNDLAAHLEYLEAGR